MFTNTEQRSGSVETWRSWRRGWRAIAAARSAGLAAVAVAALLAAAPAGAQVPSGDGTVFVHSAKRGKLSGGRLTLHGVGRHVTWTHHGGRSGVTPVKHMHRRLFSPGARRPTGTLHVAGHRGGHALTFKLSRPRHNHARRTVSYRAKPLNNKPLPSRAVRAARSVGRFGAASLSIVSAPQTAPLAASNLYYGCTVEGVPMGCWGTVTASGLAPNQELTVTVNHQNGLKGGLAWSDPPRTDKNGNLNTYKLNLLCFSDVSVDISGVAADGTTVVTAHADGPTYIDPLNNDPVCSNDGP